MKMLPQLSSAIAVLILALSSPRTESHPTLHATSIGAPATSKSSPKFLLELDLSSCHCQNITLPCQLAISASTLLEISCKGKEEAFCCSISQIPHPLDLSPAPDADSPRSLNPEPEEEDGDIAEEEEDPAYRLVPVLPLTEEEEEESDQSQGVGANDKLQLPKKICTCKPTGTCDPNYLDLRFGFNQCSHNMSRCCEPLSPQDLRLIPMEEEKTAIKCVCLPESDCRELELSRSGWRDEGSLCPGGMKRCCQRGNDWSKLDTVEEYDAGNEPSALEELNNDYTNGARKEGVGVGYPDQPAPDWVEDRLNNAVGQSRTVHGPNNNLFHKLINMFG